MFVTLYTPSGLDFCAGFRKACRKRMLQVEFEPLYVLFSRPVEHGTGACRLKVEVLLYVYKNRRLPVSNE